MSKIDDKEVEMGLLMLKNANEATREHLLSDNADQWKSGYLTERSKNFIERTTGKKVRVSIESGEEFYRLEDY